MLFIAHRGQSADAPENTMAAYQLAWQKNCKGIECDIWLTKDNVVVCHHDQSLKRTTGMDANITDVTFEELQKLDVGVWKGDKWKNERIPTFNQLLASTPKGKKLFVEVKDSKRIIPYLMDCIEKSSVEIENICIISFHEEVIAACKEYSAVKAYLLLEITSSLVEEEGLSPTAEQLIDKLKKLDADGIDVGANQLLSKKYVDAVKMAGFEFHIWTVDEPEIADVFISMNVDSITSNNAALMDLLR